MEGEDEAIRLHGVCERQIYRKYLNLSGNPVKFFQLRTTRSSYELKIYCVMLRAIARRLGF